MALTVDASGRRQQAQAVLDATIQPAVDAMVASFDTFADINAGKGCMDREWTYEPEEQQLVIDGFVAVLTGATPEGYTFTALDGTAAVQAPGSKVLISWAVPPA